MKKMTTLIQAGNYWDGLAAEPLGYAEILIEDGVIVEVGKKIQQCEDRLRHGSRNF